MVAGYAEESLQLAATEAVYAHNNLSLTQLNQQLFGNDANKIPSTLQSFIRRHFITQLKALIRHLGKKRIYNEIKNGSSKFIKKFSENYKAKKLDCLFANCPDISLRLKQLINEKSEGSILTEFGRYFERIRNKFAPLKAEEIFRMNLFEWFSSGEMTWDIFMCVKTWHKNGAKLRELKKLKLPPATGRDLYYKKVIVSCNAIGTDTFMEPQKVENILCKFLDEPKIEKKLEKIVISGRLIYLKQISAKIQEVVTSEIKQIEIYASHCCHIDVDLLLYENNLSISSKKVYIWNKQVINLSGKTYSTGNSKAANAKNNSECGQDGTDGLPGFSAGNLLILTKEMVNPENLTVYQKGGRGQDGNDGGDGYNGPNGVGVTKNELEQLCVNYGSLYFGLWNTFYNYAPPRNWTRTKSEWSYGSQYGYEQYKDENGRIMTYSYAGFKNHWYEAMTYDLYFFIQGTCGKHGTKGGGNGIGGEGGYRGNARIENPETGEKFPVNTIREAGQNGANGKCGKSGTMGKNGNDMALIDRSVSGGSKFIYGSNETAELTMSYEYSDSTYNRCDGYRKHYEGKSACFASFAASDIDTTIKQAQAPVERTVRTNRSKAVAKQSIIAEEIMSNADELFANEEMFLSDACKEVSLTNAEAEEEEEAEEQETVAEQVVILKERDDNEKIVRYTPGAEKKLRPKFTAISLVERIKASGRHASHGTCAQNIFDLFAIEISFKQLETIKFHTLFQKNHLYHAVTESKLALAVIAACQNRLVSGKSYTEIINFVKDVTYRRQQKYLFTQFRNSLDEFIIDLESSDVTINPTINTEDNQIYGIKKCALKLEANDEIIDKFFASFTEHSVDLPIMKLFNIFQKQIKEHDNFRNLLVELSQNVNWLNGEIVEKHMKELTAWHHEKLESKKNSAEKQSKKEALREANEAEQKLEQLVQEIGKDSKLWTHILQSLVDPINNTDLHKRFGKVPSTKKEEGKEEQGYFEALKRKAKDLKNYVLKNDDYENSLNIAKFALQFFGESQLILTYNRHLYDMNELMSIEKGQKPSVGVYIDDGADENFDKFMQKVETHPLKVESEECEKYMKEHKLGCASMRCLLAYTTSSQIMSYVKNGYQELQKIEHFNHNAKSENLQILWIEEKQAYGIEIDADYRKLVKAIEDITQKFSSNLRNCFLTEKKLDFSNIKDVKTFSQFYDKTFQASVMEWTEQYFALTKDQKLLQSLYNRFYIDGNHLTPYELQFILLSLAHLQTINRSPIDFLLLLISSVSQGDIINVILYIRIVYDRSTLFRDNGKIYKAIELIESPRYKALLALRINEHGQSVDSEQIYKILLMLQHASNNSEQLENIGLSEWIDIANKQKWSEIGGLIKKYGPIGYYLGILDGKNKNTEERLMRQMFDHVKYVSEKQIAEFTQLIANGDILGDKEFFDKLEDYFKLGNDFQCPSISEHSKLPHLFTDQAEQSKFIKFVDSKNRADPLLPDGERTIDEIEKLVVGLHDVNEEDKNRRLHEIKHVANLIRVLDKTVITDELSKRIDETSKKRLQILRQFDNYLFKLHKKRLRASQKMAILYAVNSEKHLLEQVNTGEGKSYIIAATAIIRRLVDYRYVDIITSSPVLAERDSAEMASFYHHFGLEVGHNCNENTEERKKAYQYDVVYGDIAHFQRDYLLHTFYKKEMLGSRTRECVIVDEVDNMLLDNGNNMLYLSHNVAGLNLLDSLLIFIQKQVYEPMYSGIKTDQDILQNAFSSTKIKEAVLADIFGRFTLPDVKKISTHQMAKKSIEEAFNKLISANIVDLDGYLLIHRIDQLDSLKSLFSNDKIFAIRLENSLRIVLQRRREIDVPHCFREFVKFHLDELIKNCKSAMFLAVDHEYVVDIDRKSSTNALEPRITIIDSNTGADLVTSQWSGGFHQFLQLKHGCRIAPITLKAVFVSNVAYLKGYSKINGLSGTLGSMHESKTLIDLYEADLIKIPTFKLKRFYEHVPVIATNQEDWFQSIFHEVCDQITDNRSVLIICESIAQVRLVHSQLESRYAKMDNPTTEISECFNTVTTYQREFDEFDFGDNNPLQCSRMIIATNLAGRGTDIKLSDALVFAGGLCVLTTFLPSNTRIEEQAFGRAARCGQPGSAEIIALSSTDDGIQPSIFQLKMFRDNAEVHRLATLKSYYDFHTEIEEECLKKFQNHCSKAVSSIYSSSGKNSDNVLPTPSQIVYFALLDKWALWLDSNSGLIELCSKNPNESEKQAIIDSVDEFLAKHPFGKSSECYEVAKNWIDFPQSLISLGIIQMCHTDGFSDAEKTFDRIVADGTEFAAEVYYYKACMRMKQWSDTRSALNSLTIKEKAEFKENIEEAIEYFTKSRALFTARVQRRQAEAKIVTQFCDTAGANHISTVGFAQQHKDINTAYELIISNIDWLIGTPCKSDMFLTKEIDHVYGAGIYESFVRQGVISPNLICSAELEKWQLQILRERLKLSKKDVEKLLHDSKNDSRICLYDGKHVMDKGILMSHVKLANRTGFFTQLQRMGVFEADLTDEIEDDDSGCEDGSSEEDTKDSSAEDKDEELILSTVKHVLFVNREDLSKLPDKLQKLPSLPPETDEQLRYQIRLNSRNSDEIITYDYNDILSINDESFVKTEITELINSKVLKDDWIAQVNLKNLGNITYCDSFDGITTSEIKEFFEIDLAAAAWILEALTEFDVLKQDTVLQHRFNADDKFWAEKVEIYQKDNKNITDDNQIATHARSLTFIRNIPSIKNVTPAVIKHACDFTDDQKLVEFCRLLIAEKILEPYLSTKFRLTGKLDCSCLPESIAEEVEEFLNERLAYSFGIEYLAAAIDRSATDPRVSKEILLADDPHGELYQTLMDLGIILPSRIFTNDYNHLESNDYKFFEKIQAVIFEHRLKLYDQTWAQMEFLPSAAYFNSREHQVDEETRQIIKNGTLMMIASKEASTVWKLSIEVMNLISKCAKTVWSVVKAVGSFFYAIGAGYVKYVVSPIVETAIDVFDYCAEAAVDVASDIKKGIVEAVDYIAETAIVKAATETVKEAAKAVAEVAVNVGGAVGKAAEAVGDAVIYASEVTGVTAAAKAVGNAAVTASEAIGTAAAATGKAIADVGIAAGNAIGNAAKSVANTVASTAAYKAAKAAVETALETVKYTYKKMASYVTACVESYQYYNQCRLSARHLAIEKRGIIDEYTILRSFNEATTKQNRIELNDQIFEENVQIHLTNEANKWISNITELIKKQISKEFKQHKIRCNSDDLNEILQTSLSIIRVKTEITEHLATFSNLTKVLFYQLIKEFAVKENQNMSQLSVSSLQLIGKYDYSLILEAVIGLCNEVKENLDNNNLSLDGDNLVNVSEAVTVSTKKLVDSLALSIYVEPSMKLISVYLLECRKPPQLASMASFSANDVNLKKILTDFNDSNNSKKNSKALKEATFKLIQNLLEKFPNDKSIYRFAFKYGYPLPLKSAEMIAMAIHNTLCADHKPKVSYKSGVTLKIFDQIQTDNITSETPLFTFKTASTAKMNVQIGHVNHQLFLSQHDFEAYFGDKSTEDSNIAFFYEGLIKALPMVKGYFPRYHESFRESLIKYI